MFEKKFEKSLRAMLADRVARSNVDDLLTYDHLSDVLHGASLESIRSTVNQALASIEREQSRTLVNVRGEGYRVAHAREHEGLARRHHKKGRRQLAKAVSKARSADRSQLTADERQRMDQVELTLSRHQNMLRRLDARVSKTEKDLHEARTQSQASDALLAQRVAELEKRIAEREARQ